MKYSLLLLACCLSSILYGQPVFHVLEGIGTQERNYRYSTQPQYDLSEEAQLKNVAYAGHPELGQLYAGAPCADCYELLGARTEKTKTFVKEGTEGKEVMLQTCTDALHYKDEKGQWRTINTKLKAGSDNLYYANEQPVPVYIMDRKGSTKVQLGQGETVSFNSNLELVYLSPDGKEKLIGAVDWSHMTVGDDGMYVTDAWPGIDMEINVLRGAVKTNFHIKHTLRKYASGKLLVRDHISTNGGLKLLVPAEREYKGNLQIVDKDGKGVYVMSAATAYEENNMGATLQLISYHVQNDVLDIVLPGDFLNRPRASYPVIIDPLVSTATLSSVGGSSYSPAKTVSCNYLNAANVPANVRVTDVRWSFDYSASGGAYLLNGAVDFTLGTCRSPGVAGFFWFCNLASAGTCAGSNVSIFSDISSCIPAPVCVSYPLNINMHFYQNYATTMPCASTYVTSASPLTITVFGRTVEASAVSSVGGLTSICLGQSVTLSTAVTFGVPPYTYVWNPGAISGSPATLTPIATTPYTVTVTDACGQTAAAAQTITVTPIAANTGAPIVCIGGTTTLANAAGTGTWASSNGTVAVVGPSSGIVTGIAAGSSIISFTTAAGCYATTVVTVIPMPTTITGTPTMCVGASTTLSNPMTGGTWSSSTLAVAVVGAGTGVVSGVSAGTSVITYTTSPGCVATIVVTVFPVPSFSSTSFTNPTACGAADGTIIFNGLVPGISYTVSYLLGTSVTVSITTNAAGQLIIAGLTAGLYSGFVITSPDGCSINYDMPFTLVDAGSPPVPVAGNNSPICEGGTVSLTATSAPGAAYSWTGPGGFTSTLQNPVISPATLSIGGVYSVTATLAGCVSLPGATTVTVNPLPHISAVKFTSPVTCGGDEGILVLEGLVPGVTYNVSFIYNGTPTLITITADALGIVIVTGRRAGAYSNISVAAAACASNVVGPVTLIDPNAPPPPDISSNAPVCAGLTLHLYGADDKPGGTYTWAGPNAFSSSEQNPSIPFVPAEAQGVYTLTYSLLNCTSTNTAEIELQPIIKLKDVFATRYILQYGDSVQLNASGAKYYHWTPHNGTLNNHYVPAPWAKPKDSITVYTVHGMNEWDCHDSANLTIRVVFDEDIYLPNSFTPNGDGRNDIFRIGKMLFKKLIDFTIYNRWGQEVYHNPYDPYGGWDGTWRGKEQDMGVYYYSIIIETASGRVNYYKGDITLLR